MSEDFVGAAGNRSDSDNGRYVGAVREAVRSAESFRHFKRHPEYTRILEHVTAQQGAAYLQVMRARSPWALAHLEAAKANDVVGDPVLHDIAEAGEVSPTTLRYLKVAAELVELFGPLAGLRVAEVGVGYGGQCLVLDQVASPRSYHLFDLPPVLELAAKVLESHLLRTAYRTHTINSWETGQSPVHLVVSNYAFSELPYALQALYIDKLMAGAERGYLTMNHIAGTSRKMSAEELAARLPPFEVREETPLTAAGNYVIVWGHRPNG